MLTTLLLLCLPLRAITQNYPQIGSLPSGRLTSGEAGLPQIPGQAYFGAATAVREGWLAVGATASSSSRGAVWIISLHANGSATSYSEIGHGTAASEGGPALALDDYAKFGWSLSWLGDLDGDGHSDLAVGAIEEGSSPRGYGSVYILFLDASGGLRSYVRITENSGGFVGELSFRSGHDHDSFGYSLAAMPDLVGGGTTALAIGATTHLSSQHGHYRGTVFIVSLFPNGTVRGAPVRIESTYETATHGSPGFESATPNEFARSLALLPDMDSPPDGIPELAVGAHDIKARSGAFGAIYILRLSARRAEPPYSAFVGNV